jgi:hypothetical protein
MQQTVAFMPAGGFCFFVLKDAFIVSVIDAAKIKQPVMP